MIDASAKRLEDSAAFARELIAGVPGTGLLVVDAQLRILEADGDAHQGLDLVGIIGRRVPDVLPAAAWEVLKTRYLRALAGESQSFDHPAVTRASVHAIRIAPVRDEGTVVGVVVLSEDITEREGEHRRLVETQERLHEAHEVARLASWEWQPATDEVLTFHALSGHEGDSRLAREDLAAIVRGESDGAVRRSRRLYPNGPIWLETRSHAVRNAEGQLLSVRGTSQDVTEQELAKQETARERSFFQTTLDSLSSHVAVLDDRGGIILTNRAWEQFALMNGGTPTGLGGNYLDVCASAGDDHSATAAADGLRSILDGHQTDFSLEYGCHSPTVKRWFVLRAARFDGAGNARVVVAHDDVTQLHQAEGQASTQAALLDEVDVAVIATDNDGRITYWNKGAESQYGWSGAEAVGRDGAALVSPAGTDPTEGYIEDPEKTGAPKYAR